MRRTVRHFQKFISVSTEKNENVLPSTDHALHIPKTTSVARKPGQRKRVRNAKTQTTEQKELNSKLYVVYDGLILGVQISLQKWIGKWFGVEIIFQNVLYFYSP